MSLKFSAFKILSLFIVCVSFAKGQTNNSEKILLNPAKPAVYLEFVKMADEKPLYIDDTRERVWLKLINNTKWSIYIYLAKYGKNEEKNSIYFFTEKIKPDLPAKISNSYSPIGAGATASELKSGTFVQFSIPKNHLAENLRIRINYDFEWENWQENLDYEFSLPVHSVYFSNSDLENYLKKKSTSKKRNYPTISCGKCENSAIFLAKPVYPRAASYVKGSGSVGVKIVIDENGNVESAEAVSGHILLRSEAVKAALDSKFQPTYLSGKKVKVRDYLVYNFVL